MCTECTSGPWTSGGTETEDSPPGPPPGEGAALFSPSPEKSKFQPLWVAHVRAASSTSWTTWAWLGRGGAPLSLRFGLGRSSSGGRKRAPTATGRLRPGPGAAVDGASCRGSVYCCTAENCCAKPSTVSRTALPERWGRLESVPRDRAVTFVTRSSEVSRRAQLLHQLPVGSTLVHLFERLAW